MHLSLFSKVDHGMKFIKNYHSLSLNRKKSGTNFNKALQAHSPVKHRCMPFTFYVTQVITYFRTFQLLRVLEAHSRRINPFCVRFAEYTVRTARNWRPRWSRSFNQSSAYRSSTSLRLAVTRRRWWRQRAIAVRARVLAPTAAISSSWSSLPRCHRAVFHNSCCTNSEKQVGWYVHRPQIDRNQVGLVRLEVFPNDPRCESVTNMRTIKFSCCT